MNNSVMSVMKGVAVGMVAGVAAGVVGSKMVSENKRSIKKKANKALKSMENMLDTASYMFK